MTNLSYDCICMIWINQSSWWVKFRNLIKSISPIPRQEKMFNFWLRCNGKSELANPQWWKSKKARRVWKKDRVDCIHLGQGSIIINMQHYLLYHYYCFLGYLSYECMTCVVSMKFCRLSPVVFFGFFQKGLLKDFLIKLE